MGDAEIVAVPSIVSIPFTVGTPVSVFNPVPAKVRLLKVVAAVMVCVLPPKITNPVPASKFEPVPVHAVVLDPTIFNVLDPASNVPAVRVILPVIVCVRSVPRSIVPPVPLTVNPPQVTPCTKVMVPEGFIIEMVPVVENVSML